MWATRSRPWTSRMSPASNSGARRRPRRQCGHLPTRTGPYCAARIARCSPRLPPRQRGRWSFRPEPTWWCASSTAWIPIWSSSDEDRPVLRRSDSAMQPAPASAATGTMELPAGTNLVVRMIDGVDSDTNSVGQTFAASIDEPVMVDGRPVIPRGADVAIKLVDSKESGKLTGRAELTLNLVSVKVNGRPVDINTQSVSRESGSRGQQTAKVVGGTAVVGTILGAIAGGGKGAAIGAVAGGAAGAGAEMVLKGQRVKVPSETRLTFVLDTPVKI